MHEAIERAILTEAVDGASWVELWLASRTASPLVATEPVVRAIDRLVREGYLERTAGYWKTTTAGRARRY